MLQIAPQNSTSFEFFIIHDFALFREKINTTKKQQNQEKTQTFRKLQKKNADLELQKSEGLRPHFLSALILRFLEGFYAFEIFLILLHFLLRC